jgi:putative copper export protein
MTFFWIALVHWLHVMSGAVYFGASLLFTFALWPVMLRMPARDSRALYDALGPPVGIVMASAGHTVLWLGILRGTWFGPIQSMEMLTKTAYGHTFMTALLLTVVLLAFGGVTRGRTEARVWNGDQYQPGAARFIWRTNMTSVVLLVLILACMVAMRFGL